MWVYVEFGVAPFVQGFAVPLNVAVPLAALEECQKSLYPPIAGPLSEKSSVSSMQNSLVIRSGHGMGSRSWGCECLVII
jgi:hypothetical protein